MSFTKSLKWSFLSEIAAKAVQPVVFIILARLLTPEDFGIMAAAMMVIAFSQIFWEAGMGKALIQRQTDITEAANSTFWINLGLGVFVAFTLYLLSEPIAKTFFNDEKVTKVLRVMTLQILLGALCSVQSALLQKNMEFKKLFWVRFATVSLPNIASLPLAINGMGYWSLVIGSITGQFIQFIMLWRLSSWRPTLQTNTKITLEMSKFGSWVAATGLLTWFYSWVDSLIVGHYLGSHDLGVFRLASQFPAIIFGIIFGPIIPVLYSHLASKYNSKLMMKEAAETAILIISMVGIAISAIIYTHSPMLANTIFGSKWTDIHIILGLMTIMHGYSAITSMNGEFYRALGKPSYETIVMGGFLVIYTTVYLIFVQYGLESFALARTLVAGFALISHLILLKLILDINIYKILLRILMVSLISFPIAYLFNVSFGSIRLDELIHLAISAVTSLLVISSLLFVIEKNAILYTCSLVSRKD